MYVSPRMTYSMQIEEASLDEMWKAIECFGINRKMLENKNLSHEEIKELYLLIKSKNQ